MIRDAVEAGASDIHIEPWESSLVVRIRLLGVLSELRLLARPSGLLLLTGPTGSGKTTAIYASLNHLVQRSGPSISISTVEDPVEFSLSMVSQGAGQPGQGVHLSPGLAFAHAPGPASDHDRRDPGCGNRGHCRAGRVDGPPGHQHHSLGEHGGCLCPVEMLVVDEIFREAILQIRLYPRG